MSREEIKNPNPQGKDLVHRIGNALPVELQAGYYSEMLYLENLQETEELLRIIRAMQYLTLLTEQVPNRILNEREHFDRICGEIIPTAKSLEKAIKEYYQLLYKQLIQLPAEIATGISSKAIVERISDNLKKQFELSTIPVVAKELADNAANIKVSAKEFTRASEELCGSWRSASDKAHQAIEKIDASVSKAAKTAEEAAEALSNSFNRSYYGILFMFGFSILLAGIFIGVLIPDHIREQLPLTTKHSTKAPPESQQSVKLKPSNTTPKKNKK